VSGVRALLYTVSQSSSTLTASIPAASKLFSTTSAQAFLEGFGPGTIKVILNKFSPWLWTSVIAGSENALVNNSTQKKRVLLLAVKFLLTSAQCVSWNYLITFACFYGKLLLSRWKYAFSTAKDSQRT
jgi:hypothetical protein